MGQPLSDAEIVDGLSQRLLDLWGELNSGQDPSWSKEEVLEGNGFSARLALFPDYERAGTRQDDVDDIESARTHLLPNHAGAQPLCVRVLLSPNTSSAEQERSLYFRWQEAYRRLDDAKIWRKLGGSKRGKEATTLLQRSRDIYWSDQAPPADVKAQLIVALIQLGLLTQKSPVFQCLIGYISDIYKIKFSSQGSHQEDIQTRQEVAIRVADKLVKQWSFPEGFKDFRKYVAKLIRVAKWETLVSSTKALTRAGTEPWAIPKQAEGTIVDKMFRSRSTVIGRTLTRGRNEMTVDEVSDQLNVTKSYIYALCRRGAICVQGHPLRISKSEVGRIEGILREKLRRRERKEELQDLGKSKEAARKALYRREGRMPKIAP